MQPFFQYLRHGIKGSVSLVCIFIFYYAFILLSIYDIYYKVQKTWTVSSVNPRKAIIQRGWGYKCQHLGSGGRAVERRTVNRGDGGSIPPTAVSKLRQFFSHHICLCLFEETLKAGGPFYLVSMPGEVNYPTQGVNV